MTAYGRVKPFLRKVVVLRYEANGQPVVPIVRLTRTQWTVVCPYCGAEHTHGRGGLDGNSYGSRAEHCLSKPKGIILPGYYAAPPSAELLEAAAAMPRPRP